MRKTDAQIELSRKQLLARVSDEVEYREVNPKSFYRWLKALGFDSPPYSLDHLRAVSFYADRLGLGIKADDAYALTLEHLEEHNAQLCLTTNEDR
jgi:hypothetical protein